MKTKMFFLVSVIFMAVLSMTGCGEWDVDEAQVSLVDEVDLPNDLGSQRRMVFMTTDCDHLMDELVGVWDGEGGATDTRFDIHQDGTYDFYMRKNGKWYKKYDGKMWIDFDYSRDMIRTVLHMSMPYDDNYAVRYHMDEERVYFEEPDDFEPTKNYRRVTEDNV